MIQKARVTCSSFFIILLIAKLSIQSQAQVWTEKDKGLPTVSAKFGDKFGNALAVDGDIMVVGAPNSDLMGLNSGIVFIYELINGQWEQIATLSPAIPEKEVYFGSAVTIQNDVIVVGSPGSDVGGVRSGKVFVFLKPGAKWDDANEDAQLTASDADQNYRFGHDVAIDNDVIVVGAPDAYGTGNRSGAVYVFEQPLSGWVNMHETAKLIESKPNLKSAKENFGISVDIDSDVIVAGSPYYDGAVYEDQGAVFVYEKPVSGWQNSVESYLLTSSNPGHSNWLGVDVSIQSNVIGAGIAVYGPGVGVTGGVLVFEKQGATWTSQTENAFLTTKESRFVAYFNPRIIVTDETIFLGLSVEDGLELSSGAVFGFSKTGDTWNNATESFKLISSQGVTEHNLGFSVALSNDYLLAGNSDDDNGSFSGSVSIFKKPESGWLDTNFEHAKIGSSTQSASEGSFGYDVAISGKYAVVGSPRDDEIAFDAGSAYVFEKIDQQWIRKAKLTNKSGKVGDRFGDHVAIYANTIAVAAPNNSDNGMNSGKVYIFEKPAGGWEDSDAPIEINPVDPLERDYFGTSVDIYRDEMVISSLERGGSSVVGRVFVFQRIGKSWSNHVQKARLKPKESAKARGFGVTAAIFDEKVVVGARWGIMGLNQTSKAYIYMKSDSGWFDKTEDQILFKKDKTISVSKMGLEMSDSLAFLGAPRSLAPLSSQSVRAGRLLGFNLYTSDMPSSELFTMRASENTFAESYSSTVAKSGTTLIVGNSKDSIDDKMTGKVYLFDRKHTEWRQDITEDFIILPPNPTDNALFGYEVDIYGNNIIIGSPQENTTAGYQSGAVYFYESNQARVEKVSTAASSGTYKIGDEIIFEVEFDKPVSVSDKPFLILDMNKRQHGKAVYKEHKANNILLLSYIVAEGDTINNLNYQNEESFVYGGEVLDANDVLANRVLPPIGADGSLGETSNIVIDGIKPFITFIPADTGFTNQEINYELVLSEVPVDFLAEDINIVNGEITNFSGSGKRYVMTVQPTSEGDVFAEISAGQFFDQSGNPNASSKSLTIVYDITPPEITLVSLLEGDSTNGNFLVDILFSEPISSELLPSHLSVTNGAVASVYPVEDRYQAEIEPDEEGMVELRFIEEKIMDIAGNLNIASEDLKIFHDLTKPTVELNSIKGDYLPSAVFPINIAFSEAIKGFNADDINVSNGWVVNLDYEDTSYVAYIWADYQGDIKITIPSSAVKDYAGNGNVASNTLNVVYKIPAIDTKLVLLTDSITNSGEIKLDIVFSKPVSSFLMDPILSIHNGSLVSLDGSDSLYHAVVSPDLEGEVSVIVLRGSAIDEFGDLNKYSNRVEVTYDVTSPEVAMVKPAIGQINGPFDFSIVFNEMIQPIDSGQIIIKNAKTENFALTPDQISFTIIPINKNLISISIPSGTIYDLAGNGIDNILFQYTLDDVAPTAKIEAHNETDGLEEFIIEIQFSEPVHELDHDDFTLENLKINAIDILNASEYQIFVQPVAYGTINFALKDGAATDLAGNNLTEELSYSKIITTIADARDQKIEIFPNPVRNKKIFVTVGDKIRGGARIYLYDNLGRKLIAKVIDRSTVINLPESIQSGFYFLQVKVNTSWIYEKVIVE
ncbi:Ig-like domain-containing protein [Fulvivirgaceae bacterium BMA12]|uniref:Ig-like domain-containing protein n=1 Tax=Agaribacillus aureus TaxID=3051825 RepID=A0ABT8LCI0_9BACT|nr:Ig-like domain-containing protein [Fulvivirgaceae bacterium BMA12]